MKTQRLFFLFSFALLFLNLKCKRDDTPQGYYFQCKLDGNLYVPDSFCPDCQTATLLGDTLFALSGQRSVEIVVIGIFEQRGIKEGIYSISDSIGRGTYKNSYTTNDKFSTDVTRTGQLSILRLNKTKKEIEGTFYFKAYNPVQNKTINITEGKFRLNYKDY